MSIRCTYSHLCDDDIQGARAIAWFVRHKRPSITRFLSLLESTLSDYPETPYWTTMCLARDIMELWDLQTEEIPEPPTSLVVCEADPDIRPAGSGEHEITREALSFLVTDLQLQEPLTNAELLLAIALHHMGIDPGYCDLTRYYYVQSAEEEVDRKGLGGSRRLGVLIDSHRIDPKPESSSSLLDGNSPDRDTALLLIKEEHFGADTMLPDQVDLLPKPSPSPIVPFKREGSIKLENEGNEASPDQHARKKRRKNWKSKGRAGKRHASNSSRPAAEASGISNTQENVTRLAGLQPANDAVVVALKAEVQSLRDNEERLLQCGLSWKKERDQLLKQVAELEAAAGGR